MRLPWVADGLGEGEKESVEKIYLVAHEDASVAQDLAGMPFMRSHEPADANDLNGILKIIRDGFTANLTSSQVY